MSTPRMNTRFAMSRVVPGGWKRGPGISSLLEPSWANSPRRFGVGGAF